MPAYPTYIPAKDGDFASWLSNFSTLLSAAPLTYGLTAGNAVDVAAVTATWDAAFEAATNPATRTSVTVASKDAARASAEAIVRPLAVSVSLNAAVTDGNKTAIGVTVRSVTPTPIPAPTVAPTIDFVSAVPLVQVLQVRQPGSTGKAKPAGCIAIQMARSVGTVAATDPEQLSIVGSYGKTPLTQNFVAADQGKIVTYAARYLTRSGPGGVAQFGPWSALASFNVL